MKVKVDLVEELGQVKQTQKSKFCDTLKLKGNNFGQFSDAVTGTTQVRMPSGDRCNFYMLCHAVSSLLNSELSGWIVPKHISQKCIRSLN